MPIFEDNGGVQHTKFILHPPKARPKENSMSKISIFSGEIIFGRIKIPKVKAKIFFQIKY